MQGRVCKSIFPTHTVRKMDSKAKKNPKFSKIAQFS